MKRNSSVLIFGAGINQLELIREAKALGLTTVVIDPLSDPPSKTASDFFYIVPGDDYKTTKRIAIEHNIGGIVTGQMEKPLRLMAKLGEEMGFIFHSPEVTEKCIDKWLMKSAFLSRAVPCANGILLRAGEIFNESTIDGYNFPLIIKPRDAFSSRGVYKTNDNNELKSHLEEAKHFSSRGDVIIEEFLEGKEYSVETITFKGKTTIVQFTEKFITPYPRTVEMGHLQPADLNNSQREMISEIAEKGIMALGIDNSAAHVEVMMTTEGPRVIEIGARLGGDFISSYLTKASTGISMDKASVQVALGVSPDLTPGNQKYSLIKYLELPEGKVVTNVFPVGDILNTPGIIFAYIFVKPGDVTKKVTHSALRPACIVAEASEKSTLIRLMDTSIKDLSNKIILT